MKKTKLFFLVCAILCMPFGAEAQELLFEPIKNELSEEQTDEIDKAQRALERMKNYIGRAENIEAEYAKFKNSSKKRHQRKYERRTWEAKKFRIMAAQIEQRSYASAIKAYHNFLESADFYYSEDKNQAMQQSDEALGLSKDVERLLAGYDADESRWNLKRNTAIQKLKSDISSAQSKSQTALDKQFESLRIYLKQDEKRTTDQRDDKAWQLAQTENTIEGYRSYLRNFSTGKYTEQARKKIAELEAEAQKEPEENTEPEPEHTFRVQIAASRVPISDRGLKQYYDTPSEITNEYKDDYYKYRVGNFTSYREAYDFMENLKKGKRYYNKKEIPFIVAFDKNGNQIKITKEMKPEELRD